MTSKNAKTIDFQGVVISFCLEVESADDVKILYSVHSLMNENPDEDSSWQEPQEINFPTEIYSVGREVVTVKMDQPAPTDDADFCVVSDSAFIYIFRTSTNKSIYFDKFVYDQATGKVVNATQVRYRRSRKADIPLDRKDTFGYKDMNNWPFLEPTAELQFLDNIVPGCFAVAIVPTELAGVTRWQFICQKEGSDKLINYSIARSQDGGFDLEDSIDPDTGQIEPVAQFELVDSSGATLPLNSAVAMGRYDQQEWQANEYDSVTLQKREMRVMAAVSAGTDNILAVLDFGIGNDGQLTKIGDKITINAHAPIQGALQFNPEIGSNVAIPAIELGDKLTIEAWIKPSCFSEKSSFLITSSDKAKVPFTLGLSDGVPYVVDNVGTVVAGLSPVSVYNWTHVAASYDGKFTLYINGQPFTEDNGVSGDAGPVPVDGYIWGGGDNGLAGDMTDVRFWNEARTKVQILGAMNTPISSKDADWKKLMGYWLCNEPADDKKFTTVANSASNGAVADGDLNAAKWVSSRAPTSPLGIPSMFDDNGLTLFAYSLPYVKTETAPTIYEGADSLVHLYFSECETKQACAIHFSPIVVRSCYQSEWVAEDKNTPDNTQNGFLSFVSRQASTATNQSGYKCSFVAIKVTNAALCQVTFTNYTGYTEVWPKVPRNVETFIQVINGYAAQITGDPAQEDEDKTVYDYTLVKVTSGSDGQTGPAPAENHGSSLFKVFVDEVPDNGMTALVQAVSKTTPAILNRAGSGGVWLQYAPLLGIDMSDVGQYIQVLTSDRIDHYTGSLSELDRDLAIEAWISPVKNQVSDIQNLFIFNKPGATEKETSRYILGINDGVPYAGMGEVVNTCSSAVPMDQGWVHLAASYSTTFGIQLGGSRYMDAGNDESLKTPDAVTIESWIRLDKIGDKQVVFAKTDPAEGTSWVLYVDNAGKLAFDVVQATQTGTIVRTVRSSTSLQAGDWHHVAGVYDVAYERQVAIAFDAGSYVKIPAAISPPKTAVSTMMWVKRISNNDSDQEILFQNTDPQLDLVFSLKLYKGVPLFYVSYKDNEYYAKANFNLRRDDWVHIAGTFDPSRGASLIIDGVLVADQKEPEKNFADMAPLPENMISVNDSSFAYTVGGIATNYTFIGTMNEVSLWNRGLTLDEVRQKIQQPLASTEVGLCGYWRFNDLFGTTVMDLAGTANGVLVDGNYIRVDKGAFAQKVFVDGKMEAFERVVDPIALTESRVTFGTDYFENYLQGSVSETRLWKTGRMNWQIDYFMTDEIESNSKGLISNWIFKNGKGNIVFDQKSENNARILDGHVKLIEKVVNEMWISASFKAGWTFFINGEKALGQAGSLPKGGYGNKQAAIGCIQSGDMGALARFFTGQMSQLRIWKGQRTGAQIRGSMFTLLEPKTPGLAAFWGISNGSGTLIADLSGWGNTGTWCGGDSIHWIDSLAPVGIEEPAIRCVPGDIVKPSNLTTDYSPSVGDYGQTSADADGNLYASMMQTLTVIDAMDGLVSRFAGFKVGNLVLQYIGQAQVDPTLIGYIEGSPPLPAENLKLYPGDPLSYVGASTILIDETNAKTYSYSANREVGTAIDVSLREGFQVESETSAGLGVQQEVYAFSLSGGLAVQSDETTNVIGDGSASEELTVTAQKYLESRGSWYANPYQIDNGVGDIFYPNNIGYALVRSGTADLYAMRIEGSGSLVGYTSKPNPDIPEDMNIIMFKIDDQYIKNGTLDGWIGFEPDKSYPNLQPGEHASYFKPLEAYAIKASIEREQQQRKAYFDNFDAVGLGQRTNAFKPNGMDIADTGQNLINALIGVDQKNALTVDQWREKMARRSLCNTYVWTSDGGLYSEQQQFMAIREESSGGSYSMSAKAGFYTEMSVSVGPTFSLDAMFGTTITTQAQKTDTDSALFSLQVDLVGDQRYIGLVEEDEEDFVYTNKPSPGKVRGYRFMSFYRASSKQNFEKFPEVVDQNWLKGQGDYAGKYDPDALALRSALNNPNEVWRVMYRVTYVSRTPPSTENQGQSMAPDIRRPDEESVISNTVMIAELPTDPNATNPMSRVSDEADVMLAGLAENPVWGKYLSVNMADYKKDVMQYMRSFYGIPSK